uniref:Uncharacterized protein n=1 Tax=Arundo donax TaxID=35708 RepID=A0A0A9CB70_ARUDO
MKMQLRQDIATLDMKT